MPDHGRPPVESPCLQETPSPFGRRRASSPKLRCSARARPPWCERPRRPCHGVGDVAGGRCGGGRRTRRPLGGGRRRHRRWSVRRRRRRRLRRRCITSSAFAGMAAEGVAAWLRRPRVFGWLPPPWSATRGKGHIPPLWPRWRPSPWAAAAAPRRQRVADAHMTGRVRAIPGVVDHTPEPGLQPRHAAPLAR